MQNMKYESVLFIGRFQPFHLGHLEIIKKYSKNCSIIKIVIGSKDKSFEKCNPFTYKEREEMVRLALYDSGILNYEIYHIKDVVSDDEWRENIKSSVKGFDALITGNKSVKEIFCLENVDIDYFDEEISRYKGLSSTQIRKDWLNSEERSGLPVSVFYYLKKIRAFERLKDMNKVKE